MPCGITISDFLSPHKAPVVSSLDTFSGGSWTVCLFFKNNLLTRWTVVIPCKGVCKRSLRGQGFCITWFCHPFPNLLHDAGGDFCTVAGLWMVIVCCCLGDLRPLYGVWSCPVYDWHFGILLRLVARASNILLRSWAWTMGHFDALCDSGKHISQYGTSSADSPLLSSWCSWSRTCTSLICGNNFDILSNIPQLHCLFTNA